MGVAKYRVKDKIFWRVDVWLTSPSGRTTRFRKKKIPTREQAEALEAKVKLETFEDRFFRVEKPVKLTVADGWALYEPVTRRENRSWNSDVGRARHLLRHLGAELVVTLGQAHIDRYRDARRQEVTRRGGPPTPQTLDHEVGLLKRYVEWLRKEKKIPDNPLADVSLLREPNTREVVISDDQLDALAENADATLKPIVLIGYDTGMRKSEILKLTWERVDLREGCLRLGANDTKTKRSRNVYLTARTLAALRSLPRDIRSNYVFVNPRTGRRWNNIRRMWRRACRAAGLPEGVWFHDTRRSFCTNARRRGVPESVVMRMSGHRTRTVFDRYNIVEDEDVRQAVSRIEAGRTSVAPGHEVDTVGGAATTNEEAPPAK